jgi:hypothetical protein
MFVRGTLLWPKDQSEFLEKLIFISPIILRISAHDAIINGGISGNASKLHCKAACKPATIGLKENFEKQRKE